MEDEEQEREVEGGNVSIMLCGFHDCILEGARLALVTPSAPRPLPRDQGKEGKHVRAGSEKDPSDEL